MKLVKQDYKFLNVIVPVEKKNDKQEYCIELEIHMGTDSVGNDIFPRYACRNSEKLAKLQEFTDPEWYKYCLTYAKNVWAWKNKTLRKKMQERHI